MPDVTVVIPTLNRWELLSAGALRSALAQEDVDLEVVIVDDGSTDATAAGLASLDDERVRVVRHEKPQGLARARNAGIAQARGEWVAFLDDDDLWAPWKLRTQLDLAETTGATFVYSPALYVSGRDIKLEPAIDPGDLTPRLLAGEAIPAGGSNVLVKTDAVREVGGFDEAITHLGDFDCWIRLDPICQAARCDEPLLAYIQQPEGMHLHNAHLVPSDVRHLHRKYESQYEALGRAFDGETFVVWIANLHRAAGRYRQAGRVYLTAAWHYRSLRYLLRAGKWLLRSLRGSDDAASAPAPAHASHPAPDWLEAHLQQDGRGS